MSRAFSDASSDSETATIMDSDACASCRHCTWDVLRTVPYVSLFACIFTVLGAILGFGTVAWLDEGLRRIGWAGEAEYLGLCILCFMLTLIIDALVLPFAFLGAGKTREAFWWNWGCSLCCLTCYRYINDIDDDEGDAEEHLALEDHDQKATKADHACKKTFITVSEAVLFLLLVGALLMNLANVIFLTVVAFVLWLLDEACKVGEGTVALLFAVLDRLGIVEDSTVKAWLALCEEDDSEEFFVAAIVVGVASIILVLTQMLLLVCLTRNATLLRVEPRLIGSGSDFKSRELDDEDNGMYAE